mmetsp:Transcript_16465/g.25386  ORF Transcript_16465/g.25386 Transcript_16465/m.25386 type:complete len:211 (+) Transcript_16465:721-1353(+)
MFQDMTMKNDSATKSISSKPHSGASIQRIDPVTNLTPTRRSGQTVAYDLEMVDVHVEGVGTRAIDSPLVHRSSVDFKQEIVRRRPFLAFNRLRRHANGLCVVGSAVASQILQVARSHGIGHAKRSNRGGCGVAIRHNKQRNCDSARDQRVSARHAALHSHVSSRRDTEPHLVRANDARNSLQQHSVSRQQFHRARRRVDEKRGRRLQVNM